MAVTIVATATDRAKKLIKDLDQDKGGGGGEDWVIPFHSNARYTSIYVQ